MFCLVCMKLNDGKRVRANLSYLPSELKQNCDSASRCKPEIMQIILIEITLTSHFIIIFNQLL